MNTQNFDTALAKFVALIQKKTDEHIAKPWYKSVMPDLITTEAGSKYVRIVKNRRSLEDDGSIRMLDSRSVWGFVEKETGDVFKAAGWKVPAKHARGNIFCADPWAGMTVYGPEYLR